MQMERGIDFGPMLRRAAIGALFASPPCAPFARPSRAQAHLHLREAERRVRASMVRLHLARLRRRAELTSRSAIMAEEDKGSIAAQELRLFVERVERLREEKKGIEDDLKDVFSEMKGRGYDVPRVKDILKIRGMKKGQFEEQAMILETYMAALGMI